MPPTNPLDELIYADAIKTCISVIGYKAAAEVLLKESYDRLEATQRQALSMDGAFANEIAEIVKDYPGWEFKFEKSGEGGKYFRLDAKTFEKGGDAEHVERLNATIREIKGRVQEAFRKYNKLQLPYIDVATTVTPTTKVIEDEA